MKAELKTITPEWASEILAEKNAGNRPMNRIHVETLAKEMRRGKWKVNGDTICLNGDRLIDGQHRLAAVVMSGMPIQSFVVEGLPSDVFDTIDVGKRRSAGDTLGVLGEKNTRCLAAVLALVDKYVTGRSEKSVTYTNTEIEELLKKYPNVRNFVQSNGKSAGLIQQSILYACHYLFSQKDPDLADEFVEKVVSGAGLDVSSPWYVLRERLVSNSLSKGKLSRVYVMALCIKAWNHARSGTALKNLRWREKGNAVEQFPIIR